jgi:hypothetical protein
METLRSQWCATTGSNKREKCDRQTDMDGPIMYSSLTLYRARITCSNKPGEEILHPNEKLETTTPAGSGRQLNTKMNAL